jgi:hypothetical protein
VFRSPRQLTREGSGGGAQGSSSCGSGGPTYGDQRLRWEGPVVVGGAHLVEHDVTIVHETLCHILD